MKNIFKFLFFTIMSILTMAVVFEIECVLTFADAMGLISLGGPSLAMAYVFADVDWADGQDNMGGLQTYAYYALYDDITTFPTLPADSNTLSGSYVMDASKQFQKIYNTLEAGFVTDETQGERDGVSFKHVMQIFVPGAKADALAFCRFITNSKCVFIGFDAEGQRRVIGSEDFPAEAKPAVTTGQATADRKGTTIEISSFGVGPAPVYNGPIPLSGGAIPPVS